MGTARSDTVDEPLIEDVRRFNRLYTKTIGVLEEGMLQTPFSLQEARVIYELGKLERTTASELAARLSLDAGYLSRILAKIEADGLVKRQPGEEDRRRSHVTLTAGGRKAFRKLDEGSRKQVGELLASLAPDERSRLQAAMQGIERLLDKAPGEKEPFTLRGPRSGDYGWIVHRHGILYNREYGWDETFEALVAEIVAEIGRELDPKRERCWIAEREGEFAGCVFLIRNREQKHTAQLRLLLVEPAARGLGIGRHLVGECTAFARQCGYRKIVLWTQSVLRSARRIYQAEGYRLVSEEKHHSWGRDLTGQYWELSL
jgi:DNA-binding MarR family transcriptional regulator/GNAT superfamily N-acetyltransferase